MTTCNYKTSCDFYNDRLDSIPALAELMKENYCLGNFLACARYAFAKANGCSKVPDHILPNEHDFISLFHRSAILPQRRR